MTTGSCHPTGTHHHHGQRSGEAIPGVVPDLVKPPSGCSFNPRCAQVLGQCHRWRPRLVEVAPEHLVACYLYPEVMVATEERELVANT